MSVSFALDWDNAPDPYIFKRKYTTVAYGVPPHDQCAVTISFCWSKMGLALVSHLDYQPIDGIDNNF